MDGALPSFVAGLLEKPVIAVPTSIGYGANLGGIAPLMTMLNSCAPGLTVVNIDNGFGAAMAALRILAVVKQSRAQAAVVNAVAVEEAEPSPALA
jgi:NCAIR mutase (PurE)-related protein